ncbi:hypothetical protein INR49_022408, partial [Caranx melampygus]
MEDRPGYIWQLSRKKDSFNMDRGWFIGYERICPSESEQQMPSSCSHVSRPRMTINLTEMLQADKPSAAKKPVPIRPPSSRVSPVKTKISTGVPPVNPHLSQSSDNEWKSCTETKASWVSTITKTWLRR